MSLPENLCSGFLRPENPSPSTSAGFEPTKLGSRGEHFTPRPPRSTVDDVGSDDIFCDDHDYDDSGVDDDDGNHCEDDT